MACFAFPPTDPSFLHRIKLSHLLGLGEKSQSERGLVRFAQKNRIDLALLPPGLAGEMHNEQQSGVEGSVLEVHVGGM